MRDISDEILLAGFCVCKHDVGITITADLYGLEQGLYLLVFFLLAAGEGEGVRPLESGPGKDAAKQKESSQQEPPFYCAAFIIQNLSAGEKYGAKFL